MSQTLSDDWVDPVIEAYKPGVDRTLLLESLQLDVEERMQRLQSFVRFGGGAASGR